MNTGVRPSRWAAKNQRKFIANLIAQRRTHFEKCQLIYDGCIESRREAKASLKTDWKFGCLKHTGLWKQHTETSRVERVSWDSRS